METVGSARDSARELVEQMVAAGEWPEPSLLRAIEECGEAAVEPLREVVRREYGDWPADALLLHAAGLLCDLQASRAIPELLTLFYRYESDVLEGTTDDFPLLGPAIVEPALAIGRDEALDWYARSQANTVAIEAAGDDPERRALIGATLREELAELLARPGDNPSDGDVDVASSLVSDLINLPDPEARPLVDAAFKADLVDLDWVRPEDVEESYREPFRRPLPAAGRWLVWYTEEYRRQLEREHEALVEQRDALEREREALERALANEVRAAASGQAMGAVAPIVHPGQVIDRRKLGRNDLCWCGSGKKYKRCHLDADRRAS